MFAELIFASFIAAAGGLNAHPGALTPQHAVMQEAGQESRMHSPRLQLAADLGCPRYYRRGYDYPSRCHRRHADPYHDDPGRRYHDYDDRYHGEDRGRYSEHPRDRRHDDDGRFGFDPDHPRDTLTDRHGRPYPDTREHHDERYDPPYRSGAFGRDGSEHDRHDRGFSSDDGRFDTFRESGEPAFRRGRDPYYHRSSHRGSMYKKKDTDGMTPTAPHPLTAGYGAGSTV